MKKALRVLSIVMLVTILFTGFSDFALAQTSQGESGTKVDRIYGKNRVETAIEISKKAYKDKECSSLVITGYNGEADALTGTILASYLKAPMLLVRTDHVEDIVIDEFKRLGTTTVYILGGEKVVSKEVEEFLKKQYTVKRLAGKNRAQTAVKIANYIDKELTPSQRKNEIFLAQGYESLSDALAIGPVSAINYIPVLLTGKDKLPKETLNEIQSKKPSKITIIGGEGAVSKKLEKTMPKASKIVRIEGNNRAQTAINIAEKYFNKAKKAMLANGWTYVDALVGGHLAAKEKTPIILSKDLDIGDKSLGYIWTNRLDVSLLGGKKSLSNNIVNKIRAVESPTPKFDINKPKNKEELKQVIETKLKNRPSEMEIKYYGKDIKTSQAGYDFVRDLAGGGSYTLASIDGLWVFVESSKNSVTISMEIVYRETLQEEKYIDKEVKRIIGKIIKPGMSQYEKVERINHYIIDNTRYDGSDPREGQSLSVLLKTKAGVCNAYALAASRFLDEVGIENYFVVGEADNGEAIELHAWNKVKIDGKWYNLDTTWNLPEKEYGKHYAYNYFLNSDEKFSLDHSPYTKALPKCLDGRYDYQYEGDYSGVEEKYIDGVGLEEVLKEEVEQLELERKKVNEEIELEDSLQRELEEIIEEKTSK